MMYDHRNEHRAHHFNPQRDASIQEGEGDGWTAATVGTTVGATGDAT